MEPLAQPRALNAGAAGRSPEGTAMRVASSPTHIAKWAGLGRPGARPKEHRETG